MKERSLTETVEHGTCSHVLTCVVSMAVFTLVTRGRVFDVGVKI